MKKLRSPVWPDPTAGRGMHKIDYAVYPHNGGWKSGGTSGKQINEQIGSN